MTLRNSYRLKHLIKTALKVGTYMGVDKIVGRSYDHNAYAHIICDALSELRGPVAKIGQILATTPGGLPPVYGKILRRLHCHGKESSWHYVHDTLRQTPFYGQLRDVEERPRFSASLGQVHYGFFDTTTAIIPVAIKVQHPLMQEIVHEDLHILKKLLDFYHYYHAGLDLRSLYAELTERLIEELDYTQEHKHSDVFARTLQSFGPYIVVPKVLASTKNVLVTCWHEGQYAPQLTQAPQSLRNMIGALLFHGWYGSFYQHGLLHGDAHFGNYAFDSTKKQLILYDFGCVRVFESSFIQGVFAMYDALKKGSPFQKDKEYEAYRLWGFQPITLLMIETLRPWVLYLYNAILDNKVRTIDEIYKISDGARIAQQVHRALRHQMVEIPGAFLLLDRVTVALGSSLIMLGSRNNWHQLFELWRSCA